MRGDCTTYQPLLVTATAVRGSDTKKLDHRHITEPEYAFRYQTGALQQPHKCLPMKMMISETVSRNVISKNTQNKKKKSIWTQRFTPPPDASVPHQTTFTASAKLLPHSSNVISVEHSTPYAKTKFHNHPGNKIPFHDVNTDESSTPQMLVFQDTVMSPCFEDFKTSNMNAEDINDTMYETSTNLSSPSSPLYNCSYSASDNFDGDLSDHNDPNDLYSSQRFLQPSVKFVPKQSKYRKKHPTDELESLRRIQLNNGNEDPTEYFSQGSINDLFAEADLPPNSSPCFQFRFMRKTIKISKLSSEHTDVSQ